MRITICGSLRFAEEMLDASETLKALGHDVLLPQSASIALSNCRINEDRDYCHGNDVIKTHFRKILDSEAILVLNYDKDGIRNYVGGATLMEIGFAHFNGKKVFLLNPVPDLRYGFEISLTNPVILDGDLNRLSDHL